MRGEFAVLNEVSEERIAEIERDVKDKAEQLRKKRVLGRSNTSGLRGVSRVGGASTWRSIIKVNYQQISLGNYKTKEDASRAYNEAAVKYFGDKAKLNPI